MTLLRCWLCCAILLLSHQSFAQVIQAKSGRLTAEMAVFDAPHLDMESAQILKSHNGKIYVLSDGEKFRKSYWITVFSPSLKILAKREVKMEFGIYLRHLVDALVLSDRLVILSKGENATGQEAMIAQSFDLDELIPLQDEVTLFVFESPISKSELSVAASPDLSQYLIHFGLHKLEGEKFSKTRLKKDYFWIFNTNGNLAHHRLLQRRGDEASGDVETVVLAPNQEVIIQIKGSLKKQVSRFKTNYNYYVGIWSFVGEEEVYKKRFFVGGYRIKKSLFFENSVGMTGGAHYSGKVKKERRAGLLILMTDGQKARSDSNRFAMHVLPLTSGEYSSQINKTFGSKVKYRYCSESATGELFFAMQHSGVTITNNSTYIRNNRAMFFKVDREGKATWADEIQLNQEYPGISDKLTAMASFGIAMLEGKPIIMYYPNLGQYSKKEILLDPLLEQNNPNGQIRMARKDYEAVFYPNHARKVGADFAIIPGTTSSGGSKAVLLKVSLTP